MISTAHIAAWNLVDILKSHKSLFLSFGVEIYWVKAEVEESHECTVGA
jgi:hypothetical protein